MATPWVGSALIRRLSVAAIVCLLTCTAASAPGATSDVGGDSAGAQVRNAVLANEAALQSFGIQFRSRQVFQDSRGSTMSGGPVQPNAPLFGYDAHYIWAGGSWRADSTSLLTDRGNVQLLSEEWISFDGHTMRTFMPIRPNLRWNSAPARGSISLQGRTDLSLLFNVAALTDKNVMGESLSNILANPGRHATLLPPDPATGLVPITYNALGGRFVEKVYLDPAKGYSFVRLEQSIAATVVPSAVWEILELRQAAPGVWFPVHTRRSTYEAHNGGQPFKAQVTEIWADPATLHVNTPVAPETFQIKFPPGTHVNDSVTRRQYVVPDDAPLRPS